MIGFVCVCVLLKLKHHELLQNCSLEQLDGESGTGRLVWARNPGSVFWPALIATFEDKKGEERVRE
jgi:hypothetical protein